ncbi:putative NAD(P)H oxidoreductase YrkL [Paenibacillus marchantiophytorum]|uniref:NAD(P)H oxidoreductase YrkL n=1 Tax=Paenibacillus marchantiophytorum TaxID=1619310 RepID=A0ABQ1FG98_9BACL|nr:NAD(P)H-dependent oxidoreductase [Paenibacillus marchantiophytorum]GGA11407.1 putative NAD(P)H oxidoreductase YrkL [Paenibacillus marchantiophytorum]
MKILVIAAHPNLRESRVNKRWVTELHKYPEHVTVHELYAAYPGKTIDIEREQALIAEHDRLVLQFPLQWYSTPAMLKQWVDDVFTTSWLFSHGGRKVAGKELILAISIGGAEATYQAGGLIGYTISELMRPLQALANQINLTLLPYFTLYGAVKATDEEIEISAAQYAQYIVTPELNPRIAWKRSLEAMQKTMMTD